MSGKLTWKVVAAGFLNLIHILQYQQKPIQWQIYHLCPVSHRLKIPPISPLHTN